MPLTLQTAVPGADQDRLNIQHEQLLDSLERINPHKTPVFSSMSPSGPRAKNQVLEWDVDSWSALRTGRGPGDGYDVQAEDIDDSTENIRKMGNVCEAFRQGYGVGWQADVTLDIPGIGVGNILARGAFNALTQIKERIECAFTSFDQVATRDAGAAKGGLMAGLRKLIDFNNKYANADAYTPGKPTDLHFAADDACISGDMDDLFNLALLQTLDETLARALRGGSLSYAFLCGFALRKRVTALVDPFQAADDNAPLQIRSFNQELDNERLKLSIRVIELDYITLFVMPTLLIGYTLNDDTNTPANDDNRVDRVFNEAPENGYFLPTDENAMLFKSWAKNIEKKELPDNGGGDKRYARAYLSLGVKTPVGYGFLEHVAST